MLVNKPFQFSLTSIVYTKKWEPKLFSMWVSKWWPSFHFCVYYPFKTTLCYGVKAPIAKKEHNNALVQINK